MAHWKVSSLTLMSRKPNHLYSSEQSMLMRPFIIIRAESQCLDKPSSKQLSMHFIDKAKYINIQQIQVECIQSLIQGLNYNNGRTLYGKIMLVMI